METFKIQTSYSLEPIAAFEIGIDKSIIKKNFKLIDEWIKMNTDWQCWLNEVTLTVTNSSSLYIGYLINGIITINKVVSESRIVNTY